jgi:flagella basal body P-ring formation protein FlgA
MRGWCALLLVAAPLLSQAQQAVTLHVDRGDAQALQRALMEVAQQILEPTGTVLDREHARLSLSGELPASGDLEARPSWSNDADIPALPLRFELRPQDSNRAAPPVLAILAVKLQRPVLVAERRLRKGSHVSCADFTPKLRELDDPRRSSWLTTCNEQADASALRDIAAGEALRAGDVGRLPDVLLGAPVQVSASSGGITVTAVATALADARVGDQLDVRLQRPARTLRTRVTARGAAQLMDAS